eukprot:XP_001700939.1 predicted protein [Chlamydomonas reinhardtii]
MPLSLQPARQGLRAPAKQAQHARSGKPVLNLPRGATVAAARSHGSRAPAIANPFAAAMAAVSEAAEKRYLEMTSKAAKVKPGSSAPSFEAPSFSMPDFSGVQLPKFSAPDLSSVKIQVPKISLPESAGSGSGSEGAGAGVTLPKVEIPSFKLDLDLPELPDVADKASAAVGASLEGVSAAVGSATAAVYGALPAPAQVLARDLGEVVGAFAANPASSLVLAGLVGVPLGAKAYLDRYGGYSGDLAPAAVKELLAREDALVVDVRSEAQRAESGILDLRKSSRYRAAALPADSVTFSPKWAKERASDKQLGVLTAALLIANLTRVSTPLTKVVIMNDKDDVAARDLARAVRQAGVLRVYVMGGGFQAWQAAGLGVVSGRTEYDASALAVFADEVAEVAAEVTPKLKDPAFLTTALATSSLAIYAAANYHTTLRYVAVWGIMATIYARLSKYNSPQELPAGVIKGSLNLPTPLFKQPDTGPVDTAIQERIRHYKEVVVHCLLCAPGKRGPTAAAALQARLEALGVAPLPRVSVLTGGVDAFMKLHGGRSDVVTLPPGGWKPPAH